MLIYIFNKSKFIIYQFGGKKCFLVKSGKIAEILQVSNKAVEDYIFPEKIVIVQVLLFDT